MVGFQSQKEDSLARSLPLDAVQQNMEELSEIVDGNTDIENAHGKARDRNEEELFEQVKDVFAMTLKVKKEKLKMQEAFLAQGGDSLLAIQIVGRCREAGFQFDTSDLLRANTLEQMCYDIIKGCLSWSATHATEVQTPTSNDDEAQARNASSPSTKTKKLTPMQHFHMFGGQIRIKLFELAVKPTISETILSTCLNRLVQRHEILRATVHEEHRNTTADEGYPKTTAFMQIPATSTTNSLFAYEKYQYESLSNCQIVLAGFGEAINIENGQGFAAVSFTEEAQNARFLGLLAHCSLVDGQAWNTIVKDLSHLLDGEVSVQRNNDTETIELASQGHEFINDLTHDEVGAFTTGDADTRIWVLPIHQEITTKLLPGSSCHKPLRTEPLDFLTAALYLAYREQASTVETDTIDMYELHQEGIHDGSTDIDFFENLVSIDTTPLKAETTAADLVRLVKDIRRRSHIESPGQQHQLCQKLKHPRRTTLVLDCFNTAMAPPEAGKSMMRDIFQTTSCRNGLSPNTYLISTCMVKDRLCFTFQGTDGKDSSNLIEAQKKSFGESLSRTLHNLLLELETSGHRATLSDFPLLKATYLELDDLIGNKLKHLAPNPLADIEDIVPCSPMQEAIMISQSVDDILYQCAYVFKMTASLNDLQRGPLDPVRLANAWSQVVQRHEALRTVFMESRSRPGHFDSAIFKRVSSPVAFLETEAEIRSVIDGTYTPIKFGMLEIPHRFAIFQKSEKELHIRIDASHTIIDGESIYILFQDAWALYNSEVLIEPGCPYRSFVFYYNKLSLEESVSYWTNYLSGSEPTMLPLNYPDSSREQFGTVALDIDTSAYQLDRLCGELNITLVNLCQLAWGCVLGNFAGSSDVQFSYVTSGRQAALPGIAKSVGTYINTVSCRLALSPALTIIECLQKIRDDFIQSLSHQFLPLSDRDSDDDKSFLKRGNTLLVVQRNAHTGSIADDSGRFEVIKAINRTEVCHL